MGKKFATPSFLTLLCIGDGFYSPSQLGEVVIPVLG